MIIKDDQLHYKLNKKTLIIVRGIPGSGKSTFANKLKNYFEEHGYHGDTFESDSFFVKNGVYKFNPKLLYLAHKICYDKVFNNLEKENVDFSIVANTFILKSDVKKYREHAEELGYDVMIFRMTNKFKDVHEVPEETLQKMRESICNIDNEIFVEAA